MSITANTDDTATDDYEFMPRDMAIVWVKVDTHPSPLPIMDLRCVCGALVDITVPSGEGDLYFDRIQGNSNNGYRVQHHDCAMTNHEDIKYVSWALRVQQVNAHGQAIKVWLTPIETATKAQFVAMLSAGIRAEFALKAALDQAKYDNQGNALSGEFDLYLRRMLG